MGRSMRPGPKRLLHGLFAAVAYGLAGLWYLRPIARLHADHLTPSAEDPLFTLYVLKWVMHQARLGFPDLWNANAFFPAKGALAFSDPFLAPALEVLFVRNAISGYNLLLFTSFVLCGLAMWWVLAESGCSAPAAILGGAMFAFCPFRWSHLNHMAMLVGQWIPLTLWSFDRLLAERTPRRAVLFALVYVLNLTSGCYFAYMTLVALLVLCANRLAAEWREVLSRRALAVLAPAAIVVAVATVALFLPFLRLSRTMDMARDEATVVRNAAALTSYLSPAPENTYSLHPPRALWARSRLPRWEQPFTRAENTLFPGILASAFAVVGAVAFVRRWRNRGPEPLPGAEDARDGVAAPRSGAGALPPLAPGRRLALAGLLLLALAAVAIGDLYTLRLDRDTALAHWLPPASRATWLALGALFAASVAAWTWLRRRWLGRGLLHWRDVDPWERGLVLTGIVCLLLSLPLAYVPLMRLVPGLDAMRVPARFAFLVEITVVFLAARGIDALRRRIARPAARATAVAAIAVALFVELAPRPLHWVPLLREEQFPEVYRWLAGRDDVRAIVEVPMKAGGREAPYMYFSTLHWKPIANGYSSFLPLSYVRLSAAMGRQLPSAAALDLAASMGVTHAIVHSDRLGPPERYRAWEQAMAERLDLVEAFGADRVYRLRAPTAGS